jgi:predicted nuclease of predicted toxin-antitoxin system
MKLLLDMGVSPRTADHLNRLEHDAVHLRSRGLQLLADHEVVRLAELEGRTIVTFDLDYAWIIALERLAQPSVVLLRLESFTTDGVNAMLENLLSDFTAELQGGAILVVDSHRIRLRRLPIW